MANRCNTSSNSGKKFTPHNNMSDSNKKAPPGFKYVPAKVLVPIPAPENKKTVVTKTTYVTNYVISGAGGSNAGMPMQAPMPKPPPPFNPHPKPVRFSGHHAKPNQPMAKKNAPSGVTWEMVTPESAIRLSDRAIVGGHEGWDGSPLWVIRARQGNDVVPGKLAIKHKAAYVPFNGKEVPVQNIEVLCAPSSKVMWVAASNGSMPFGAIPGGHTANGETLYIAKAKHNNSVTPGKVHPSHRTCYISFSGKEVAVNSYEVLCTV